MRFAGRPEGLGCPVFVAPFTLTNKTVFIAAASKTLFARPCLTNRNGTHPHQAWGTPQEDVMRLHEHLLKSVFGKAALATAALSGFLLFAGTPSAKANEWDDCNRRAAYADWRLHVSIEHFGYYSPEAGYWRHERHEAYERVERYRRHPWRAHEWREREWREHEWREHHRGYDGYQYRYHRDWDRD